MSPKPFGKPTPRRRTLPRLLRGSIVVLAASPVIWLAMHRGANQYRTLRSDALLWPAMLGFFALFVVAVERWLAKRPVPRGPWESGGLRRFLVRALLAALIAAPAAAVAGHLYQPTFQVLNGRLGNAQGGTTWAIVEVVSRGKALRSPYWDPDFRFELIDPGHLAKQKGSLAVVHLGRGALGALWVRQIDIEELP